MRTEETRSGRQLVRLGFVLAAIAALAAEYTLDRPGVPGWLRLAQVAFLIAGAAGIHRFLGLRGRAESVPSAATMIAASLMIAALWALDLGATLLGSGGLPYELLLVLLMRDAALSAIALSGNPVCLRLSGGLTLAAMLFSSVLAEHRVLYALSALYALLGSYWLILLYWSVLQVKLLEGTNRRPPVLAIVVWGLLVGGMTVLVVGPGRTIGVLGELLPTSGGSTISDPSARSGVGDGPNLARGVDDPTTTGPVDSDLFLETRELSLFDASNEKWGDPEEINTKRSLAVAVENPGGEMQEERSRQSDPTREFSAVRGGRRRRAEPPEGTADAAFTVRGKTPVHIRLMAYDDFDGRSWAEPAVGQEPVDLRLGFAGWIEIPGEDGGIDAGVVRHEVVVGNVEAPQLPLPAGCDRFRIDLIERPDFFALAQDGILRYRAEYLPKQTSLETRTPTVDPARLRRLAFPPGPSYAMPRYLTFDAIVETPGGIKRRPADPRIAELASRWTEGIGRGWPQVEAIVSRLRTGYERDSDAILPVDCEDAVAHFLFERRRGDDYLFATAACMLLRSLGYPTRFVQGLYADPRHFDEESGWTPVLMPRDLHTWAEVQLPCREWVVVEATPGFEVLGPEPSLMARLWGGVRVTARWIGQHPVETIAVVLVSGLLLMARIWIAAAMATLAWRVAFRGEARRRVIATVRLLERRAALSGRGRPRSWTLREWYGRTAADLPDVPARSAIHQLIRLADWACYAPPQRDGSAFGDAESIRRLCLEFARVCTRASLRAIPGDAEARRPIGRNRRPLLTGAGALLLLVVGLSRARVQEDGLPELPPFPEIFAGMEAKDDDAMPPVSPSGRSLSALGIEPIDEMSEDDERSIATLRAITAVFFFMLGAAIGSFLNVVVYRMPRRMSLWGRRSHCPACQTPLTFRENVPIVGWLRLLGRCNSCSAPISPRYPLVEAATGSVVLALLFLELLSGGGSVPVRQPNSYNGVVWILWYPKWDLIGLFAYHAVLLCSVLCVTLIAADRMRIPIRLVLFAAAIGYLGPMIAADLHPVPPSDPRPGWLPGSGPSAAEAASGLIGHLAGLIVGGMLLPGARRPGGILAVLGLAGLYLGWQAAVSTGLMAAAGMVVLAGASRLIAPLRAVPPVASAGFAVLVQILAWRWLSGLPSWPSHDASPAEMAGALTLIALLSGLSRWIRPWPDAPEEPASDTSTPIGLTPDPADPGGAVGPVGEAETPQHPPDATDPVRDGDRASAF
ncbi:prepilin peptidase [Tautonia sociabilis]|uniref:Transglutaminase-like domain-containing protein n=1 Tax=Tautonia sociabilis TaxID=2080755 RepID=A0A432MDI7_9BACT|nr:prepilin peptidase [Tautonia sociabilis]RUL82792.1 hypothetical protein TsocGM_23115 [Tautonia sociabilis]